jgi:hypothetical protein
VGGVYNVLPAACMVVLQMTETMQQQQQQQQLQAVAVAT